MLCSPHILLQAEDRVPIKSISAAAVVAAAA